MQDSIVILNENNSDKVKKTERKRVLKVTRQGKGECFMEWTTQKPAAEWNALLASLAVQLSDDYDPSWTADLLAMLDLLLEKASPLARKKITETCLQNNFVQWMYEQSYILNGFQSETGSETEKGSVDPEANQENSFPACTGDESAEPNEFAGAVTSADVNGGAAAYGPAMNDTVLAADEQRIFGVQSAESLDTAELHVTDTQQKNEMLHDDFEIDQGFEFYGDFEESRNSYGGQDQPRERIRKEQNQKGGCQMEAKHIYLDALQTREPIDYEQIERVYVDAKFCVLKLSQSEASFITLESGNLEEADVQMEAEGNLLKIRIHGFAPVGTARLRLDLPESLQEISIHMEAGELSSSRLEARLLQVIASMSELRIRGAYEYVRLDLNTSKLILTASVARQIRLNGMMSDLRLLLPWDLDKARLNLEGIMSKQQVELPDSTITRSGLRADYDHNNEQGLQPALISRINMSDLSVESIAI